MNANDCNNIYRSRRSGHINVLNWLKDHGCPLDSHAYFSAVRGCGDLNVLKWLKNNGCPHFSLGYLCRDAALTGKVELLKFAIDNGYVLTKCTSKAAAISGNLETLELAIFHHCHWSMDIFFAAATSGHKNILEWGINHQHIKINSDDLRRCKNIAKKYGHKELAKWLTDLIQHDQMLCGQK